MITDERHVGSMASNQASDGRPRRTARNGSMAVEGAGLVALRAMGVAAVH